VRIRDEQWTVVRLVRDRQVTLLDVSGRERTNRDTRATFVLPFELLEPLPATATPRLVRRSRWRHAVRAVLADTTPSWPSLRAPLDAKIALFPFQLEPALAVAGGLGCRLLIADEVGLGKTIQAGLVMAEILSRRRHGRVLVVAPASLKEQWQGELRDRFGFDPWVADTPSLAVLGEAQVTGANPWSAHQVTITSIDLIKRPEVMRAVEPLIWDAVVFDEAHALGGRSDRAVAARALGRRARTVLLLTATPHQGDERTFDALCDIGNLEGRFPLLVLRRTRRDVGLAITRRTRMVRVRPSLAEASMHRALLAYARAVWARPRTEAGSAQLAMIVLLRRASSSPTSLARSVERRLSLLGNDDGAESQQLAFPFVGPGSDDEPLRELGGAGLASAHAERMQLERILDLARRAATVESKLSALVRLLRRSREPAIVFTEYRDTLTHISGALADRSPVLLHGGLTPLERRDVLSRFTRGDTDVLLATDAASEGLNLQARCRLVINLELPWTPARVEQRIGRVERIGQRRAVHAVHLLASGTPEELTLARLVRRSALVSNTLDALRPQVSEEEVAGLVFGTAGMPARSPATVGDRLVVPGLDAWARREATRLEQLRALGARSRRWRPDPRAPVTVRRHRYSRDSVVMGYRLSFTDADSHHIWDTLLGLVASVEDATRAVHTLDTSSAALLPDLHERAQGLLSSLVDSLRSPLALALDRERAIERELLAARARLSALLVQPGLFDRRAMRESDAQRAVLDEALDRCRSQLDEIAALGRPLAERPRLAFAVIRR